VSPPSKSSSSTRGAQRPWGLVVLGILAVHGWLLLTSMLTSTVVRERRNGPGGGEEAREDFAEQRPMTGSRT
jgi:hypothetical protein